MTYNYSPTAKLKNAQLDALINPLARATYECDTTWDRMEGAIARLAESYGTLELNPDFQRGHVWTKEQQMLFVENCIRGVVTTAGTLLQFNCANWNDLDGVTVVGLPLGMQCVDGLQRYTAIAKFMKGEITAFGLEITAYKGTRYCPSKRKVRLAVHACPTREKLLQLYLDLNSGGTVHSREELERIRKLLAEAIG